MSANARRASARRARELRGNIIVTRFVIPLAGSLSISDSEYSDRAERMREEIRLHVRACLDLAALEGIEVAP